MLSCPGMRHSALEPGVAWALKLLPVLQIFSVLFLRRSVEAALGIDVPLTHSVYLTLLGPLFLLAFTWIPWWQQRLGRMYVPAFVVIASIYLLLEKYLVLAWLIPPAQHGLGVLLLIVRLWMSIFLVTLLVVWQSARRSALWVPLALCSADSLLSLPYMTPGTSLYSLTLVVLVTRLIFIMAVAVVVQWLINQQREQSAALRQANGKLAQLITTSDQLAASQERIRLARELHDTLAHSLSGVAIQLEAAEALWELNPNEARRIMGQALYTTQNGLTEVRRALQALRAGPLEDRGLALAVADLARAAAARARLRLDLDVQTQIACLAAPVEHCVYRVAQESLANVVRHANATLLRVSLHQELAGLILIIADNGRGFELATVSDIHYGLQGLRERAAIVGATLQIASVPQHGTTVQLVVPTREVGI